MGKEKLCTVGYKISAIFVKIDEKVFQQFGFRAADVSLDNVINYLYTPKDSSSLAVTRILFGIAMLFDIAGERGGATMMERWGNPNTCHFPLLPFVRAIPMPYMALVYAALWLGAMGITLGYKYRASSVTFAICYWYLFLIEKSFWNNHSYLFGLVATLLSCTNAHCYWSIDAVQQPNIKNNVVPYWNYFILKYQFFILYFMAGLKKGTAEWLDGYSVQNLSEHWVFNPFKLFLTVPQTDYLVVHWFVFAFDLTVAVWMMWGRTRHIAMLFCALFHLMNSRLFSIGMFPWVCLATMPLFYPFDWPKTVGRSLKNLYLNIKEEARKYYNLIFGYNKKALNDGQSGTKQLPKEHKIVEEDLNLVKQNINDNITTDKKTKKGVDCISNDNDAISSSENVEKLTETINISRDTANKPKESLNTKDKRLKIFTVTLISLFILTQAFLPFSHFITQGYNNWTKGLYGYTWDMMVHTWDTNSVIVKVVDNENKVEFYIDPYLYAPNDRWTRHGDMLYQYAHCIKHNLVSQTMKLRGYSRKALSNNLSIYVDVWCSMNGRFTQRMFDPQQDLLNATWSPFEPMTYLLPLLDEALSWRSALQDMKQDVHSWHNNSDVIFIADFPGYDVEKYIPMDLNNVTLTVLEGDVVYEPEAPKTFDGQSYRLNTGSRIKVKNGIFHRVLNIDKEPAFYMYTFFNASDRHIVTEVPAETLPIGRELTRQFRNMAIFFNIVFTNILQILKCTRCHYV